MTTVGTVRSVGILIGKGEKMTNDSNQKWFLDHFFGRGGCIISHSKRINGFSHDTTKELKRLTELINYGCEFDSKGKCKDRKTVKCCCEGCGIRSGYLERIYYDDLPRYFSLFKKEEGFWTKKGCSLPRELRSVTCLSMNCNEKKMTPAEKNLLYLITVGEKAVDAYYNITGANDLIAHIEKRLRSEK